MLLYYVLICLDMFTYAHIFMREPPSRRNKYSEYYVNNGLVDYNIMAPLNSGYLFPCKGFSRGPSTRVVNGNNVKIELEGSATHGGGHCQFGITYDDRTFIVLKTVLDDCLVNSMSYEMELPNNIPSDDVTIFWTWMNRIGNREYYMECADITLNNQNGDKREVIITGKELLVVNLPGYSVVPEGLAGSIALLNSRRDISIKVGRSSRIVEQVESMKATESVRVVTVETKETRDIETKDIETNDIEDKRYGDATYYYPNGGIGACGMEIKNEDVVCALGAELYDMTTVNGNPNVNEVCGKCIRVEYNSKSVECVIRDRCSGCMGNSIDLTSGVFEKLTLLSVGRIEVSWAWCNSNNSKIDC